MVLRIQIPESRLSFGLIGGVFLILAIQCVPLHAQGKGKVLEDLIRGTARVGKDVPIREADELAEELSRSRAAREAIEAEIKESKGMTHTTEELAKETGRSAKVIDALKRATSHMDPSIVRRIEELDGAGRESALLIAKGGETIGKTMPDIATRGRFLREGGAETVAAIGIHGEDAARAAMRLDEAIRSGSLVLKDGQKAVTLVDFGRAMTRSADASWAFWTKYVQPHWKVWLASGALAAYLANPDYFQNKAGELTETGFKRLTEFIGEAAAAAIRGVGKGGENAVEKVKTAFYETYFHGWNGLMAAIGTLLFLVAASLLFPRTRHYAMKPLRWLCRTPHPSETIVPSETRSSDTSVSPAQSPKSESK